MIARFLILSVISAASLYSTIAYADKFKITYEDPGVMSVNSNLTSRAKASGIESFDNKSTKDFTSDYGTAGKIKGNYAGVTITSANLFGGAGGVGKYAVTNNKNGYTLSLTTDRDIPGVNYFGFWLSALDKYNRLEFYRKNELVGSYKPENLIADLKPCDSSNQYCGNPSGKFKGQNKGQHYAFVNFYDTDGYFDLIKFYMSEDNKGGYESDNHTVAYCGDIQSCITGKVVEPAHVPTPISQTQSGSQVVSPSPRGSSTDKIGSASTQADGARRQAVVFVSNDGSAGAGSRSVFTLTNTVTRENILVPVIGRGKHTRREVYLAPGTYRITPPPPSIGKYASFTTRSVSKAEVTVGASSGAPILVKFSQNTRLAPVILSVKEVTDSGIELGWGSLKDMTGVRYVLVRTDGSTPATKPTAGARVPLTQPTDRSVVATGLAPNHEYTFTLFATSSAGKALPTRSMTVSTARPGTNAATFATAPNTIVPTNFASLQARRVAENQVRVTLNPADIRRGSGSQLPGVDPKELQTSGCIVGTPFLVMTDVAGNNSFYGAINRCEIGPGKITTAIIGTDVPLSTVFNYYHLSGTTKPSCYDAVTGKDLPEKQCSMVKKHSATNTAPLVSPSTPISQKPESKVDKTPIVNNSQGDVAVTNNKTFVKNAKDLQNATKVAKLSCKGNENEIARWSFEGDLNDGSGNKHQGKLEGTATYTAGFNGQGIKLNGKNNAIIIGKKIPASVFASGDYTISGVFKSAANGNIFSALNNKNEAGIGIELAKDGLLRFVHRLPFSTNPADGINLYSKNGVDLRDNKFHTFSAVTHDGRLELIVDGVSQATAKSGSVFNSDLNIFIGKLAPGKKRYFNGVLDEISIYNAAVDCKPSIGEQAIQSGPQGLTLPLKKKTDLVRGQPYWSPSGEFFLQFNTNGNLVVKRANGDYIWGLDTQPNVDFRRIGRVTWQADGNLAAYTADDRYIWSALHSNPDPKAQLTLDDDGVLLIVAGSKVIWRASRENQSNNFNKSRGLRVSLDAPDRSNLSFGTTWMPMRVNWNRADAVISDATYAKVANRTPSPSFGTIRPAVLYMPEEPRNPSRVPSLNTGRLMHVSLRKKISCESSGSATFGLNPAFEPSVDHDLTLNGNGLRWDIKAGIKASINPEMSVTGKAQCSLDLSSKSFQLSSYPIPVNLELKPDISGTAEATASLTGPSLALTVGFKSKGKVSADIDMCDAWVTEFPCGIDVGVKQKTSPLVKFKRGDIEASLEGTVTFAAGVEANLGLGVKNALVTSKAGFSMKLAPISAELKAKGGSSTCISASFGYQIGVDLLAEAYVATFGDDIRVPLFESGHKSYPGAQYTLGSCDNKPTQTRKGKILVNGYGLCLDAHGHYAKQNGGKVHLWKCNNNKSNQHWTRNGKMLVNGEGLCLDASGNAKQNGAKVHLWKCHNKSNQHWTRKGKMLINGQGLCLDASGNSKKNGGKVHLWKCHNKSNQHWRH